ncbi:HSP20-like chaperone [Aspergillus leporis]|jgi:HSP20 family molecular chaperone IbpA|uniref:HSP20-like chaperone n=1 Tax=Aspergillus leporis TaxID=41062 RepID=A0A5N5X162_9EURO|nr:HSP20-like chaperone [Aspergillus leporis]
MSLFRTISPASDFSPLFRLLDDYDVHRQSRGQSSTSVRSFAPRFDVRETGDAYHFDGELPGIAQKDIDIEFSDPQTLVIKGRSQREYHSPEAGETQNQEAQGESKEVAKVEQNKPRFWVSERSIGEFHRSFTLPARIDQDKVKASLKNGILSLVVPKAAAPSARKITIDSE